MKRLLLSIFLMATTAMCGWATNVISKEGAWCWFADPRAIHYANDAKTIDITLLGCIDVRGSIKATQIDWLTGKRTEVLIRAAHESDDHDNPTFLVLPDERIMIFYSYHSKSTMFYRVSKRPGDITYLGPEKQMAFDYKTTYPSPFILSDDPDHIWICWRGGENWHPTIARTTLPDENDDVKIVYEPKQMVQSTGARPYAKYQTNGKDKLYVTYTTGHPDNEMPNWVYFNVIGINGGDPVLLSLTGDTLKHIADGPFNVDKTDTYKTKYPQTLIDAPTDKRDWVWQTALDKQERPVVLFTRLDDARTTHNFYYTRWTGTEWCETGLGYAGHAFHKNWSSRERCYSSGMALDPDTINHIYLSLPTKDGEVNVNGVYELWKYVIDDEGAITSKTQLTYESKKNNVRPYVLPGSAGTPLRLAWMNGDYYFWVANKNYPQGFPTSLVTDCELPVQPIEIEQGLDAATDAAAFTISVQTKMPTTASSYLGTFFNNQRFSLDVISGYLLQLTLDSQSYKGSGRFLATDHYYRGVNPVTDQSAALLPKATMTLTYDGQRLTLYRNELVDLQLDVEGLTLGDIQAGTYANAQLRTWNRPLNNDEVRQLVSTDFATLVSGIREFQSSVADIQTCYNLSGQRTTTPVRGLNIIRTNKTTKKTICH